MDEILVVVVERATREFDADLDEAELVLLDDAELDLLSFGLVIGRICLHSCFDPLAKFEWNLSPLIRPAAILVKP